MSYLQALNFTWPEENLCVYEVNLRNLALVCGRDLGRDLTALVIFHVFFFNLFVLLSVFVFLLLPGPDLTLLTANDYLDCNYLSIKLSI